MKEITRTQAIQCQPSKDNVILQVVDMEAKSHGGIFAPSNMRKRSAYGRVVAIGPGRHTRPKKKGRRSILVPCTVQPGMVCLLPKWYDPDAGEYQGEKFLIGRETELVAIMGSMDRVSVI